MNLLFHALNASFQSLAQQVNSTQTNSSDIQRINEALGNLGSNLPTVFGTIGLALLGILIPLTIAILQDIMQKKGEQCGNYCVLDLHVILDKVFQTKRLIFYSALVFFPFLFWDIQAGVVHVAVIISSLVGIILIGGIIFKVYNWIKGNVSSYRLQYLQSLDNESDMVTVWGSIWKNSKITPQEYREFFEIYNKKIDGLIRKYGVKS
jgi:hypothetical protein